MRHERHGVEPLAEGDAEAGAHAAPQDGRNGRAADQDEPAQRAGAVPVGREQPLADLDRPVDQGRDQRLEVQSAEHQVDIDAALADPQPGQEDRHLGAARQLDLRVLGREPQPAQRLGVRGVGPVDRHALAPKLFHQEVDDRPVEIAAAEEVVAVMPDDAQQTVPRVEQGHVERPAAEVIDHPGTVMVLAGPSGGDRGGHGFLDQFDALETGEPRGFGGGCGLVQFEKRRDRDDRALRRDADLVGHILPQRSQDLGRQILGAFEHLAGRKRDLVRGAEQPLELALGVGRVEIQEASGAGADEDRAAAVDTHHARGQHAALSVADDGQRFTVEDRHRRIAGSKIDPDIKRLLGHIVSLTGPAAPGGTRGSRSRPLDETVYIEDGAPGIPTSHD